MTSLKRVLTLICLAASCLSTQNAMASHPFHVSSAEIEYNQNRETFEVAICLWPEDLAKAVSKMEQKTDRHRRDFRNRTRQAFQEIRFSKVPFHRFINS